jgi:hypothetical protein
LSVAGQRRYYVAGQVRTIRRGQRCPFVGFEIIPQQQFVIVAGQDQVDSGSLEFAVEKQMGVGNNDRVRRRMRRMMRDGLDPAVTLQMQVQSIGSEIRVEFAGVIQNRHRKRVNFL